MSIACTVKGIDWARWHPTDHATLLFVICGGEVLLIHKKRGLGAGKINGPGGRMEPGETARECAVREVEEELLIRAQGVTRAGTLHFQFLDGYSIQAEVFTATGYEGEPTETEEAIPLWVPINELPYDRMWADDPLWVPLMLAGKPFVGYFVFDADNMLDHDVRELSNGV
jgi:8-oxo-dGTP diphosphatase